MLLLFLYADGFEDDMLLAMTVLTCQWLLKMICSSLLLFSYDDGFEDDMLVAKSIYLSLSDCFEGSTSVAIEFFTNLWH